VPRRVRQLQEHHDPTATPSQTDPVGQQRGAAYSPSETPH
jgi:hypothetical protein